jgi:IS30 family transposase
LAKVNNKIADLVVRAIEDKLKFLRSWVNTLTVDNGKEFADHKAIDQTLSIQTYFAESYCSWQRGSNENFNGLLRQYIPKERRMKMRHRRGLDYDRKKIESPAHKAVRIQDSVRGVSRLVKPCCISYMNPP